MVNETIAENIDEVAQLSEILDKYKVDSIFKGVSKAYGTGAHVYIPKEYIGREVVIIIKKPLLN